MMSMRFRVFLALIAILMLAPTHARAHYSPELGRWLERDPAIYRDTQSLYENVASRPSIALDPLGLELVIVGDEQFRKDVLQALQYFCPEARLEQHGDQWIVVVERPEDGWGPTEQHLRDIRQAQQQRRFHEDRGEDVPEDIEARCIEDPICSTRPGCERLIVLINDLATHRVSQGESEEDINREYEQWHTDTFWSRDERGEFHGFDVLWHELTHAYHTASGVRNRQVTGTAPDGTEFHGWEEVFTIEEMNDLVRWGKRCLTRPALLPAGRLIGPIRDPFDHRRSRDLRGKERPDRPQPIVPRPVPNPAPGPIPPLSE